MLTETHAFELLEKPCNCPAQEMLELWASQGLSQGLSGILGHRPQTHGQRWVTCWPSSSLSNESNTQTDDSHMSWDQVPWQNGLDQSGKGAWENPKNRSDLIPFPGRSALLGIIKCRGQSIDLHNTDKHQWMYNCSQSRYTRRLEDAGGSDDAEEQCLSRQAKADSLAGYFPKRQQRAWAQETFLTVAFKVLRHIRGYKCCRFKTHDGNEYSFCFLKHTTVKNN